MHRYLTCDTADFTLNEVFLCVISPVLTFKTVSYLKKLDFPSVISCLLWQVFRVSMQSMLLDAWQ